MISRTLLFFGVVFLFATGCKSTSPKKISALETPKDLNVSVEDPNKMIIEPLSAGHFETLRVAFYNLENLFDTIDGPNDDAEYLPQSPRNWNSQKYQSKLRNMARVIDSLQPHILGVCEVENLKVLEDLKLHSTWLSLSFANIVHQESPDKRGIDVALFYTPEWAFFGAEGVHLRDHTDKLVFSGDLITVQTGNPEKPTRGILHATFKRYEQEFTVFVNHWTSRGGGEATTRSLRFNAANALKGYLQEHKEITHWVAMGDFNDNPEDSSLRYVLGAGSPNEYAVNLAYELRKMRPEMGTGYYRGAWDMFDQIIISRSLYHLGPNAPIPGLEIYKRDWLLQTDLKYIGQPLRTFGGKTYLNGYSDHLPVQAQLYIQIPVLDTH